MICTNCNEPLKEHEQPIGSEVPRCTSCRNASMKSREGRAERIGRAMDAFGASNRK